MAGQDENVINVENVDEDRCSEMECESVCDHDMDESM